MTSLVIIRHAHLHERVALEELQLRAAMANPADRAAMLANPDAIELSRGHIEAGRVFVAEERGIVLRLPERRALSL